MPTNRGKRSSLQAPMSSPRRSDMKDVVDEDRAERQRAYQRAVRIYERRRKVGWTLLVLGIAMAILHMLTHAKAVSFFFSISWADLLIGYPMAGLFVLIAAISLGQLHPSERTW